jgi:sodium-dependent dicarboxylate transporter 2/3/5
LIAGPLVAVVVYIWLPSSYANGAGEVIEFSHAARATAAVGAWMALWWMTEAIPIYATALLPLALFPFLGATSMKAAAAPYGHDLIFLFMGGFMLALSMERWGLHRRIALGALGLVGTRPTHLVGGFMVITAVLSMWVSNTATTIMMLPIATSIIDLAHRKGAERGRDPSVPLDATEEHKFALCLLLGIAYAASIGGIGTLVGTPPNLFLASYVKTHMGLEISFVKWMGIGVPLVVVFLPVAWLLLTRLLFPVRLPRIAGGRALTKDAYRELGPMQRGEWVTMIVFACTALLWVFRPLLKKIAIAGVHPLAGLTDPGIAMLAAVTLFVIPVDRHRATFVMDWQHAVKLPWGVLVLFGGGLSLAAAIEANGVGAFIGNQVSGLAGLPHIAIVASIAALMVALTELTSNTASTATLVPILYAMATGIGLPPLLLVVPAAIAASCAFMLPVATPPNAIIFGTGMIRIPQMVQAGVLLGILGVVLITALTYFLAMPLLGVTF